MEISSGVNIPLGHSPRQNMEMLKEKQDYRASSSTVPDMNIFINCRRCTGPEKRVFEAFFSTLKLIYDEEV